MGGGGIHVPGGVHQEELSVTPSDLCLDPQALIQAHRLAPEIPNGLYNDALREE